MKILVTGAEGQLGRDVVIACSTRKNKVVPRSRDSLDLTDGESVMSSIDRNRPDVVVNCAAFTAVDLCETEVEAAHEVNEHGARRLAEVCDVFGAHLVHISTDYVFDGTLDRPYREDDEPNPQSVYGRSKLAGENAVTDVLGARATIVRTSWVCGEYGNNMVKLVRRLASAQTEMKFVNDQIGHPTFTADLAMALGLIVVEQPGGVFHLTNSGVVSWYEFVQEILTASGHDPDMVRPVSTAELQPPRPAHRPANSVLDNARWAATGHTPLRDFRNPLTELVARL